ncbi:hypothetical protein IT409_02200 [Candidatus Falkowbacteria bacterium]|nr:hypothetical protein [Candidatus Falkowbacteria bacterium]
MSKIELSTLPELKDFTIINSQRKLDTFLSELRQDWYSKGQLKDLHLDRELALWLQISNSTHKTCFAVFDEKDDFATNDNWGNYDLYRCIAVQNVDGKIYLFKSLIHQFRH